MSMLLRSPILLGSFYIIILLGIFYFNRDFFLYYYEFSVLFGIAYIFFYFINGFPILLGNCYIIKDFLCCLGFPILLGILHVIRDFLYYWGFFILLGIFYFDDNPIFYLFKQNYTTIKTKDFRIF
jgi:hypothetical protein